MGTYPVVDILPFAIRGIPGDRDMPVVVTVDLRHDSAERIAMRGGVGNPLMGDMEMYHLVDHYILPFLLREIEYGAYPHLKVEGFPDDSHSLYPVAHLSGEGACFG